MIILFLVFAVAQHDTRREWLTVRTEVLINHLVNCERHPEPIREKARVQKASMSTKSPRKAVSYHDFGNRHWSSEGGTAVEPPYPQPMMLQVQTPAETYQSAYTLTVPPSSSQISPYTSQASPSIPSGSSSGSSIGTASIAPSDSYSLRGHIRGVQRRRASGKSRAGTVAPAPPDTWSDARQLRFEEKLVRLTASAGLPLSWVENPEWLSFCTEFLPSAKSPSRKVLTRRLLPRTLGEFQSAAKQLVAGQNVTVSCDGWTGENFHHYIAFMIVVNKKVWILSHPCLALVLIDARYTLLESMTHRGNARQQNTCFNLWLRLSGSFNRSGTSILLPLQRMLLESRGKRGRCYLHVSRILYARIAMPIRSVMSQVLLRHSALITVEKDQSHCRRLFLHPDNLRQAQQISL